MFKQAPFLNNPSSSSSSSSVAILAQDVHCPAQKAEALSPGTDQDTVRPRCAHGASHLHTHSHSRADCSVGLRGPSRHEMGDDVQRAAGLGKSNGKGDDPWAASAAKLGAEALPAHVRKQLEELLADQVRVAATSFESTAKKVCEDASAKFLLSVSALAQDFNEKHSRTEREVTIVKTRMDKAEADNTELKASVARLQSIVSEAEARVPSLDITSPGAWNREPDPVTFWCGSSVPMAENDIKQALADWFRAAGVTDAQISFNTVGPLRRHSFSVVGGTLLAEPRARKLFDALRIGKDWRDFSVSVDGTSYPLYVSGDKSPKMVRREVQIKKLAKLLQAKTNLADVKVHRSGGYLSYKGDVLVQILVGAVSDQATTMRWAAAAVTHNIDDTMQNAIAVEFTAAFADPLTSVQWL